jgi:heme a synthase
MATFGSILERQGAVGYPARDASSRGPQVWLFVMAALVFTMVAVGGATRLTGSGLSITEWQPIMGTIPPLSVADWQDAFQKYQQIPQYQLLNKGMSLDAFKGIFWWEWGHRFLGRFLGVAFLLPFLVFLWRGQISPGFAVRLAGLFVLGGLLIWTALDLSPNRHARIRLRTLAPGGALVAAVIAAGVFLQIGAGALVAGLKAGLAYNTWPLMDGHLVPSGLLAMAPWWRNVFENAATVQFDHRLIAYALTALIVWHGVRVMRSADDERMRHSIQLLIAAVACQVGLGIWTLVAAVPLQLALAHQAMAMLVLAAAVWHLHSVARG